MSNIEKKPYLFLDTETTGTEAEDRLCQVAFKNDERFTYESLYKPPLPIKIGAMAVCHITNKMVEKAKPFKDSKHYKFLEAAFKLNEILIAHNAKFDIEMLKREGLEVPRYICTMKLARHFDTKGELEKVSLQYLRYYYGIETEDMAHDAAGDVNILEKVFYKITEGKNLTDEQMIDISMKPALLRKMPFGKHKGVDMVAVPKDYISWLSKQADLDEDLAYTLKQL